jgi:hypothetical protein
VRLCWGISNVRIYAQLCVLSHVWSKMRNIFENDEDFLGLKLIGNGDTKICYTPFPIEQIAKYQR